MFEWLMDFGVECNQQCTINPGNQSASIFYVPRFSASNEPAGFDGNVFSAGLGEDGGWGGGEKGVKVMDASIQIFTQAKGTRFRFWLNLACVLGLVTCHMNQTVAPSDFISSQHARNEDQRTAGTPVCLLFEI